MSSPGAALSGLEPDWRAVARGRSFRRKEAVWGLVVQEVHGHGGEPVGLLGLEKMAARPFVLPIPVVRAVER
jgi:hypothetical protein